MQYVLENQEEDEICDECNSKFWTKQLRKEHQLAKHLYCMDIILELPNTQSKDINDEPIMNFLQMITLYYYTRPSTCNCVCIDCMVWIILIYRQFLSFIRLDGRSHEWVVIIMPLTWLWLRTSLGWVELRWSTWARCDNDDKISNKMCLIFTKKQNQSLK